MFNKSDDTEGVVVEDSGKSRFKSMVVVVVVVVVVVG